MNSSESLILSEIRHQESHRQLACKSRRKDQSLPNDCSVCKLLDWNLKSVSRWVDTCEFTQVLVTDCGPQVSRTLAMSHSNHPSRQCPVASSTRQDTMQQQYSTRSTHTTLQVTYPILAAKKIFINHARILLNCETKSTCSS